MQLNLGPNNYQFNPILCTCAKLLFKLQLFLISNSGQKIWCLIVETNHFYKNNSGQYEVKETLAGLRTNFVIYLDWYWLKRRRISVLFLFIAAYHSCTVIIITVIHERVRLLPLNKKFYSCANTKTNRVL